MTHRLKNLIVPSLMVLPLTTLMAHAACTIPIGIVLPTSGELSAQGQENVQMAQLAIQQIDKAGGPGVCRLKAVISNSQTKPAIGVDAAKKLVDLDHVPAIVGASSSGVSMAILTSVTAPSHVVQISPSSTSPAFTTLAQQGKTGGYWFRTAPSDALQGVAMASVAHQQAKLKRVAVMYLNNPYGSGLAGRFEHEFKAMGGTVTASIAFNPRQPSYRSEVHQAMQGHPQALFLVGYPNTGEVIVREWISAGGPHTYLFPDALHAPQFVSAIGGRYLDGHTWGTVPGNTRTRSLGYVAKAFKRAYGHPMSESYDASTYDATAIAALAAYAAKAGGAVTGARVRDMIPRVTDPKGAPIYASVRGFRKAEKLLAAGKPIRYIGASGALHFNATGDVKGPMVVWRVKQGHIDPIGTLSAKQIANIGAHG
ncbi:ABC transporter substrate-binding protein [Acidihalobacter yilgarnensis]|nr:ABC transporter substrate-binding protein [Acidihalobacter yilgarnensis]